MRKLKNIVTLCLFLLGANQALVAGEKNYDSRLENLEYSGVTAVDVSEDPNTVEVHLKAVVGSWKFGDGLCPTHECYMYVDENQDAAPSYPGPLIVANKGDTVIVRIKNELPEATTIHWHGMELYANQDGSHISQDVIEPGTCFTYKFIANEAKFTWYHAHFKTRIQIPRGLHGGLLIRDREREDQIFHQDGKPLKEVIMIASDVLLDDQDQFAPFTPSDPQEKAQNTFNGRGNQPLLPGTFDYLMVNGKIVPKFELYEGVAKRWRVVNVANSTFMRLAFDNENMKMWQVGSDAGLKEKSVSVKTPTKQPLPLFGINYPVYGVNIDPENPTVSEGILLTPGERGDFVVVAKECSDSSLKWYDTWRGRHVVSEQLMLLDDPMDGLYEPRDLLQVHVKKPCHAPDHCYKIPKRLASVERYDVLDQEPKTMLFNFGHGPIQEDGSVMFFATTKLKDPTLPPPAAMPVPFMALTAAYAQGNPDNNSALNPGDVVYIRVQNFTRGWHNYHQHGFDFQLIQYELYQPDGKGGVKKTVIPATSLDDKDTVLVPGRPTEEPGSKAVAVFRTILSDVGRESRIVAFPEMGIYDDTTPIINQLVHRNPPGVITTIGCSQYDYRSNGWLAHCHILEHSNAGMMSVIMVTDPE